MKKIIFAFLFGIIGVINMSAQKTSWSSTNYEVNDTTKTEVLTIKSPKFDEKYKDNNLYMAGYYQIKSAKWHYAAIGFGIGAAGLGIAAGSINFGASDDTTKNGLYIAAGVTAVGAFISEICAINYQLKSGKQLKIGATKITYTF